MRWEGRAGSGNIEDRRGRGMGMALPVGGGVGFVVLLLLFAALTGTNPEDLIETQGRVAPESFTHGTSEERMSWLRRGMDRGDVEACDTFNTGTFSLPIPNSQLPRTTSLWRLGVGDWEFVTL